ncbi:hypothetical protein DFQ27_002391 [Actinomortierella ambigua]|uniref:RING-type E3 ubiquitin transferase n=1 Tax=Actinomortierella ambigua TaxID=1343610 RepID=A0A9P6UBS4_9FUNG|nr:hypothetical protein DFQ27_002391 [Actinomortierella ambigua]
MASQVHSGSQGPSIHSAQAEEEEPEVEFLHTPSPSLLCPVCQDVCKEPLITNGCNHSYCATCIYRSMEIEPFCPLCRSRIRLEDLHPNLALAGIISELLVHCTNKQYGCSQILRHDALHGHVLYCSFAPSWCVNHTLGCPYKGSTKEAQDHVKSGKCVFETLKGYIEATNARFVQVEKVIEEQAREIERLQKILRAGKALALDTRQGVNGATTEREGAAGGAAGEMAWSPSWMNGKRGFEVEGGSGHDADQATSGGGSSSGAGAGGCSSSNGINGQNGNTPVRTIVSTFPQDEITCHRTITEHKCGVTSVAVHDRHLFAGAHDGSTKVFDIESGALLKSFKSHTMSVWGLAIAPTGERFFSAGSDGTIKVWDWLKGGGDAGEDDEQQQEAACLVATIPDHHAKVYGLVVDQGRLYSASSDKTVKVWDVETLACLATFQGHTGGVNSLTALKGANAGQLATGSSDKTIKIWDVTTGTCVRTVRRGTSEVLDVAAGDGMLFGSTYDAVVHVYDLNETRELGTLSGHNWEVWQLEYGEGCLFSASFDHTIKRWDPRRFQCDLTLKGHKSFVHGMALTDKYLVTGCADRTIKIWR